jgi:hypothetical protein
MQQRQSSRSITMRCWRGRGSRTCAPPPCFADYPMRCAGVRAVLAGLGLNGSSSSTASCSSALQQAASGLAASPASSQAHGVPMHLPSSATSPWVADASRIDALRSYATAVSPVRWPPLLLTACTLTLLPSSTPHGSPPHAPSPPFPPHTDHRPRRRFNHLCQKPPFRPRTRPAAPAPTTSVQSTAW